MEEGEGKEGVGQETQAKYRQMGGETNRKRKEKTVDKTRRQTDNKQRGGGSV